MAPSRKKKLRTAFLLALIPGLLGVALVHWPPTATLENQGLDLLFLLRGPREVPEDVMAKALATSTEGSLSNNLVDLALERGGNDNTTVIVVHVETSRVTGKTKDSSVGS